jgi:hypothetical protein
MPVELDRSNQLFPVYSRLNSRLRRSMNAGRQTDIGPLITLITALTSSNNDLIG